MRRGRPRDVPGPAHSERFALLRGYGSDDDYDTRLVGLNGKLSELHAALGCLTVLASRTRSSEAAVVDRYRERLAGVPGVRLQATDPDLRPTPTQLVADLGSRRDDVAAALAGQASRRARYFRPLHAMERFRGLQQRPCP